MGSLSSLILLAGTLTYFYTHSLTSEYQNKIDQLSTSLIAEKKRFLRNAVEQTLFLIEHEREHAKDLYGEPLSEEELVNKTKARIGDLIRQLHLIDNGYIWVNRIVNWDGGDKYAVRAIHPNLPHTEGSWLSTNTEDIKGNRPYEAELVGIKENGELFIEYYFKKMDSDKIAHKMSFAKLYEPWDWVIATGVYLDDVDMLIASETKRMKESYHDQLLSTFIISFIAVIVGALITIRFERHIARLIRDYEFKIENYADSLEELSTTDKLTGLVNRLKLDEVFEYEVQQAQRYSNVFSILLMDLDKFKQVNDTYGHQTGDLVLIQTADILRNTFRKTDTLGRWGGEEFLIILPEIDSESAMNLGNKLRMALSKHDFACVNNLTCSIGVSTFAAGDSKESMLSRADEALYCAKAKGRDTVVC